MILLVADLQELKANPKRAAVGTVVEAELDKGRGPVATMLVQTGTLRVGDTVVVGDTSGRVRALENGKGERVTKAGPSSAVVLLGLGEVPAAGDVLRAVRRREDGAGHARGATLAVDGPARGLRTGDPGGSLPPDPGRPDEGAAPGHQGRRAGLPGRHPPRRGADRHRRGAHQHHPRGHRRHHRQRHHAGVRVGRHRRRLQHPGRRDGAPGRRGRGCRHPALRHHLQADRRPRGGPPGPARAGDRGDRRGSGGGAPDLPRRQVAPSSPART